MHRWVVLYSLFPFSHFLSLSFSFSLQSRYLQGIHTTGCIEGIRNVVNSNLYLALGVGIGLLVFQILCVLLASGLAVDVHREKKFAKAIKRQERMEQDNITSKL